MEENPKGSGFRPPVRIGLIEVSSLPGGGGGGSAKILQGSEGEGGMHLVCNYC